MSALFSRSVPICVLRRAVCSVVVYSISQSPRESGTQKTRQAETLSGPGPAGGGGGGGRGGSGTGSSRGGRGAGLREAARRWQQRARSNKHTKGLCVLLRSALTRACYLQVQLRGKKVTAGEGGGGKVTLHCGKGMKWNGQFLFWNDTDDTRAHRVL